jgi:muramoyltetrapeptide carboxypeptidase
MTSHPERREFLRSAVAAAFATTLLSDHPAKDPPVLKPPRLRAGDTVGLVNPAGATFERSDLDPVHESLAALGLRYKEAPHLLDRYGYLAGTDKDRASDLNAMFADPEVQAIMAVRGGWGCARILPLIDYSIVRAHPKILIGYSDVTALLLGLFAQCGLVTFHGPVGTSTWNRFSVDYFRRVLFDGESVTFQNPNVLGDSLVQTRDRIDVIRPGTAEGWLYGGNLSVLSAIVGSPYYPRRPGGILFLEDDGEKIYRMDRAITQLALAGILKDLHGFVFGKCTGCGPGEGFGSLTLGEVIRGHIGPLGIPAWIGAMVGHIENKWTLPVGTGVRIDAGAGTVAMTEPAVSLS